jgi:hypothetical protein
MLLAAERSDEQAAGLAASLWSGRAPGKREAGAASAERSDEQAAGLAASLWSGRAPGTVRRPRKFPVFK